jgi:predicted RNase H-like nuclease
MSVSVIGVDAYPLGWVAVELHDGTFARAFLASTLFEIVTHSSGAAVIGVDIPLGMLPDRWRAADTVAADQLGPRRSSVFRVPPQPVWQQADFAAANRLCRELTGSGQRHLGTAPRAVVRGAPRGVVPEHGGGAVELRQADLVRAGETT